MRYYTIYICRIVFLLWSVVLISCDKNNDTPRIPYVTVDIDIHTNDPEFIDLNAVGGWTYITGGSRGIIVFRKSNSEFMAYDRHSPYQSEKACAFVSVDASSNTQAFEDCAKSKYLLHDGSVIQGPATFPLHRYNTSFDGSVLHISNSR